VSECTRARIAIGARLRDPAEVSRWKHSLSNLFADIARFAAADHVLGAGKVFADHAADLARVTGAADRALAFARGVDTLASARALGAFASDVLTPKVGAFDAVAKIGNDLIAQTTRAAELVAGKSSIEASMLDRIGAAASLATAQAHAAEYMAAKMKLGEHLAEHAERAARIRELSASLAPPVPQVPQRRETETDTETEFEVVCQRCQRLFVGGSVSRHMGKVRVAVPPHECRKADDDPTPPTPPSGSSLPN
jgi:hypothetical protein